MEPPVPSPCVVDTVTYKLCLRYVSILAPHPVFNYLATASQSNSLQSPAVFFVCRAADLRSEVVKELIPTTTPSHVYDIGVRFVRLLGQHPYWGHSDEYCR